VHNFKYNFLILVLLAFACSIPASVAAAGSSSLLSQGRWIKVHVDTTSVFRLPHDTLREWGFTNPDKVIVAGYGSVERAHTLDTAPDDLPILPVYHDKDAVYFYGEGDTRVTLSSVPGTSSQTPFTTHQNYYSSGSYYFIGERSGLSSPEITAVANKPSGDVTVDTHYAIDHHIYRENHPPTHGLLSYSRNITAGSPRTIDLDISNHDGQGVLYYSYIWRHGETTSQSIGVSFSSDVTSVTGSPDRLTKNANLTHRLYTHKENARFVLGLADNASTFSATISNPSDIFSTLALSNYTFACRRANRVAATPYTLYFPGLPTGAAVTMHGLLPGLMVWDVTDPRTPTRLTADTSTDGTTTVHPAITTSATKLYTFLPSANIPTPEYAEEVAHQNLHSTDGADLLIVTTATTYDAALRLAAAHQQWQGMKVMVVRQSDVFNEYSSGALHPNGLRHFVKQLASSPGRPLRYLLLFGLGSWDTRATFDRSGSEYLVMYSTESTSEMCDETKFYCSDLYFGTLSDRIGTSLATMRTPATISVGRVPATDATSAEAYVDKCITYLSNPLKAGHFNHAIIAGGIGDANQHLSAAESFCDTISAHTITPTINRSHLSLFTLSNPQHVISEQMHTYLDSRLGGDSRLFNYTGHSSRGFILHTYNIPREKSVAYGSLPVVFMSSCSTTPIDISDKSLGSTMILHNPGPIAVIGAGDEVYLSYNVVLNRRFVELFYDQEAGECLGDVFRLAVGSTGSSSSQFTNNLCYNFLGDPALPRYLPEATVNLTEINGTSVTGDESSVTVTPLTTVKLSGNITRIDGSVDTAFSGTLYINIYNAPGKRTTLRHDNTDKSIELTIDEEVLYSTAINVENGLWSTNITLPTVSSQGINRMTLNAVSTSRSIASGGNRSLSILTTDTTPSTTDTTPPAISLWLDTPGNTDGAMVSSSPTLYIEITDNGSGTSLNSSTIGMMPKILLDGTNVPAASGIIHADREGVASGAYTLTNLADGPHTVTVYARDIAGNSTTETINFTVVTVDHTATLSVSAPLVREEATFTLTHSMPTEPESMRLVIRDMEGHTVLSTDAATYPYTWNLTGSDLLPVPDGTYRASVYINARPYYTATPEVTFTIVH